MNNHVFQDPDLAELDRIWPLGRQLVVPDDGCVVVAGAYEGRYMSYLLELFPTAYLFGYEPQKAKFDMLNERIGKNPRVVLYDRGLGTAGRMTFLGNGGTDGASVASSAGKCVPARINDAVWEFGAYKNIDLLLLNIEGSEWPLIPYLLDELMHHRIRSMAIQFHPKYVSQERADQVIEYLLEYYARPYWDYPSWTYWQRRD